MTLFVLEIKFDFHFFTMLHKIMTNKKATDEEKIVNAYQFGFTQRDIKGYGFGSSKISRVIKEFNETHTIPKKLKRGLHQS